MSRTDRYRTARLAARAAAITLATISCNDDKISNSVSNSGATGGNGGNGGTGSTGTVDPGIVATADLKRDGILDVVVGNGKNDATTIGLFLGAP